MNDSIVATDGNPTNIPTVIEVSSLYWCTILTTALLIAAITLLCLHFYYDRKEIFSLKKLFHMFSIAALAMRNSWFIMSLRRGYTPGDAIFALNRVAVSLFFTTFTLIAAYWADMVHSNSMSKNQLFIKAGPVFIVINVVFYIFQLVVISLFYAMHQNISRTLYDADILVIAIASFVIAGAFVIYGIALFVRMNKALGVLSGRSDRRRNMMLSIIVTAVALCICFLLRFFAFIYRPATGQFLSEWSFYWCAYIMPELFPCALQFFVMRPILPSRPAAVGHVPPVVEAAAASYAPRGLSTIRMRTFPVPVHAASPGMPHTALIPSSDVSSSPEPSQH